MYSLSNIIFFLPLIGSMFYFSSNKVRKNLKLQTLFSFFILTLSILNLYYFAENKEHTEYYVFGNYNKAYGIEFKFTIYNALIMCLISVCYFLQIITLNHNTMKHNTIGFSLILMCGLFGLSLSNDIFNKYIFIEIVSIASYALYTVDQKTKNLKFTFDYLILNSVISLFFLLGIFFLYYLTGHLNIDKIFEKMTHLHGNKIAIASYVLIILLPLLKVGLFPMHQIVCSLYRNTTVNVTTFTIPVVSKVFVFFTIQNVFFLYGVQFLDQLQNITMFLITIGAIGFLIMSIAMMIEKNILSFFTFMSIGQLSYSTMCFPFLSNQNVYHGIITGMIFNGITLSAILSIIYTLQEIHKTSNLSFNKFKNILNYNKFYKYTFLIFMCSLAGVPITAGFVSKFLIIIGLSYGNDYLILISFILGNLFILMSILRAISMLILKKDYHHNQAIICVVNDKHIIHKITLLAITLIIIVGPCIYLFIKFSYEV